ncbi:MAG TPA: hypothetical protein VI958_08420 [Acidobacteriota bacterium]
MKLPHQKEGKVVDRNVETIDILPTIADVLGAKMQWQHDGISLLDDAHSRDRKIFYKENDYTIQNDGNSLMRRSLEKWEFQHDSGAIMKAVKRKIAVFGSHQGVQSLFDFADTKRIIGKNTVDVQRMKREDIRVAIRNGDEFNNVDLNSPVIPAILTGKLEADRNLPRFVLGISLNGKIYTVTRSIPDNLNHQRFYALLPEECFQQGKNEVDVLFLEEMRDQKTAL